MSPSPIHPHAHQICISLAYSFSATEQHYREMMVDDGTTLYDALKLSGWLEQFIELSDWCQQVTKEEQPNSRHWMVGVYASKKPLNYALQANDRIEVYRPLIADPMTRRKKISAGSQVKKLGRKNPNTKD